MTIRLHQPVVCPILVGRSTELTALQDCLEAAARGQGGVVLLSGEAGIGKSRLAAELRRSAEAQGFQLLGGQCFPTDRACPYAPLLDLLGTFLAPLSFPSRCSTCLKWQASLPGPLWNLNKSNAASSRRWQTSCCDLRPPDRSCW